MRSHASTPFLLLLAFPQNILMLWLPALHPTIGFRVSRAILVPSRRSCARYVATIPTHSRAPKHAAPEHLVRHLPCQLLWWCLALLHKLQPDLLDHRRLLSVHLRGREGQGGQHVEAVREAQQC